MKLLKVDTVEETKKKIDQYFNDRVLKIEMVDIGEALGRVVGEDVYAQLDVPEFPRSTVDGYGIAAKDSFGASESLPTFLQMKGRVEMGEAAKLTVSSGHAVYVPTGGMLPQGADAMMMIEYVETLDQDTIAVYKAAAPGDGIIQKGEDIKKGEIIAEKGRRLRPQDIGVLAAAGVHQVRVFHKPKIFVISTGDEIVDPREEIKPGQIRDINTYTLTTMAKEIGAEVVGQVVVRDDYDLLKKTVQEAVDKSHIAIISGGSSVGVKDVTAKVIDDLGEPGVFVHGVAVKPGKPTILGKVKDTALFGLPGHPVSAMVIYKVFVDYYIRKLLCLPQEQELAVPAICEVNIHSSPGKETYQLVQIEENNGEYKAKPIYGKSGAISLMTKAHGYIKIHTNQEGIHKGEKVKVVLF